MTTTIKQANIKGTVYTLEDTEARKDISTLKAAIHDVLNNTPRVETIKDFYNFKRTGKVYRTRIWLFATNPTSTGTKLLDNAGLEFTPSTDTVEGKDDYLNG